MHNTSTCDVCELQRTIIKVIRSNGVDNLPLHTRTALYGLHVYCKSNNKGNKKEHISKAIKGYNEICKNYYNSKDQNKLVWVTFAPGSLLMQLESDDMPAKERGG